MRHRLVAVVLAALVLAAGTACGSSTVDSSRVLAAPSTSASLKPGSVTVNVKNFSFNPQQVTVPVGATVTWVFQDDTDHTATANDKSFNSPKLKGGAKYQYTFTKAGTYPYMCSIHQYMTGTVIVK